MLKDSNYEDDQPHGRLKACSQKNNNKKIEIKVIKNILNKGYSSRTNSILLENSNYRDLVLNKGVHTNKRLYQDILVWKVYVSF